MCENESALVSREVSVWIAEAEWKRNARQSFVGASVLHKDF